MNKHWIIRKTMHKNTNHRLNNTMNNNSMRKHMHNQIILIYEE